MSCTVLGIDVAKEVFRLHGVDERGQVVVQKRVSRAELRETVARLSPCIIVMAACGGARYWARELQQLGHTVKLIRPQFVRPYGKGTKHDGCDAEAVCEAVGRPDPGFVQLKTPESQDIQALHRIRSRLIRERTAVVNQVRGLLRERGIVIAQGVATVRQQLPAIVADVGNALTPVGRAVMQDLHEQLVTLDQWILRYERALRRVWNASPCKSKAS